MQNMEDVYVQYFKVVKKYLFCLTHDNDIAEELTQETFCKAVNKIHTFRGDCKISVWLCQMAKNLWYNEQKKNKRILNLSEDEMLNIKMIESMEDIIVSNENKIELYKKIQRLDEKTREVIYLRVTGELSFKEIAIILNKTENWARTTFFRGKQKLKEEEEHERKKGL